MTRLTPHFTALLLALLVGFLILLPARAQTTGPNATAATEATDVSVNNTRIKELVLIEGTAPIQLTGYGLVTGLDRTGDRARGTRGTPYTVQSIVNMLQRFGITIDPNMTRSRNVAAVMVTSVIGPYKGLGSTLDVTVSALGDARSLSGGILLQTPLVNPTTQEVFVMAQGPVSTSSVLASSLGSSVKVNHTNTGRVPNGGIVTNPAPMNLASADSIGLLLKHPDFTNAIRITDAINAEYPDAATVSHAGLVQVTVPENPNGTAGFMAALEAMTVVLDIPARVVINERTGTIVAGGNVRISEVMVTYGSLVVSTQVTPFVSQPAPFSLGNTVAGAAGSASVDEEGTRSVVLPPNTSVSQLAAALNELGLTARDVIAIFQAIDKAQALQGDLVIL